ncbi:MAG: DUF262 domain-containing protein [Treponema sp.]|nr:DUF262 domain-containing protein [Treponema sp.]
MARDPLEPNLWNIRKLYENKFFEIPVYQRPYSWDADNVSILLEDILNAFKERDSVKSYYTGNVIIRENDTKTDGNIKAYDIIDGQQHILTNTRIFKSYRLLYIRIFSFKPLKTSIISKANSLYHIELNHPDSMWHKEGHQGSSPAFPGNFWECRIFFTRTKPRTQP